jgi:dephospho-CoA kinase
MFAALGAHVLESDGIGRDLMEPGEAVYERIVAHFGDGVVLKDGGLDRAALARIAFVDGRVEELNAIVHPAVIARQMELQERIFAEDPGAVVMVESALIFETKFSETNSGRADSDEAESGELKVAAGGWQSRFDRIVLVTAPEEVKVARFVARSSGGATISEERRAELESEARRRLAQQISDEQKSSLSDYVLTNGGPVTELEWQVDRLWPILQAAAA